MKSIALDTNLLLLLVVGRVATEIVGKHKRLKAYDRQDFNLVVRVLEKADTLRLIPQCVAEVSNLAVQGMIDPHRSAIFSSLKSLVDQSAEQAITSAAAATQPEYTCLGITDAAWLLALNGETTFLTDDLRLCYAARSRGFEAVNIAELRSSSSLHNRGIR